MPPRRSKDIIGMKFGELTVYHTPGKVYCKCSCGRFFEATRTELYSGEFTSCGHCSDTDPVDKTPDEYKIGMRFIHTPGSRIMRMAMFRRVSSSKNDVIDRQEFERWLSKRWTNERYISAMVAGLIKLSSEEQLLEAYRKDTIWEYVEETIRDTHTKYMKRKYRNSVNKYGEYMHQKGFI